MLETHNGKVFAPDIPPDLSHAALIREEAFDWLDTNFPGIRSFPSIRVLSMAGEQQRRWLIGRLRDLGIGDSKEFGLPATADTLAILFLRSNGVKFREAVDAVVGSGESQISADPRYGGVWNRLIDIALKRIRLRVMAGFLGSAVFALLRDEKDHPNCLVIVKRLGPIPADSFNNAPENVSNDYAYKVILERPAPSCWVLSPFREVLFLDADQLPTRSEVTERHFLKLQIQGDREAYELLLGTMSPASIAPGRKTTRFIERILEIVFLDFGEFLRFQLSQRYEAANLPGLSNSDDLQLWLITQLLDTIYPGSLCEISETSQFSEVATVLASTAAKPWEPSPWDQPKSLEMFSGYTSRTGVPLVAERVDYPLTTIIESVESEIRYLQSKPSEASETAYSAMALPMISGLGNSVGSLFMLMPQLDENRLDVEVRILTVFSRIIGEIVERQRAALHTAKVSADIATSTVLRQDEFKASLLELLERKAQEVAASPHIHGASRLPFILLSAHQPDSEEFDPAVTSHLKDWLVDNLRHLEWHSFLQSHWPGKPGDFGVDSFTGVIPGVGVMIVLSNLVTKNELDRIRHAFATAFRQISPSNSSVKLVAWVLDVSASRILEGATSEKLRDLADDVESWAHDVATVVDDVNQSYLLALDKGEWDLALRTVRKALRKKGAENNSYLRRLAADCSMSLGDWPSALKYAREASALMRSDLGGGSVRPLCQEADAYLCMGNPTKAWDLCTEAISLAPDHPLPRYHRGQGLLLTAKLIQAFEYERLRAGQMKAEESDQIRDVLNTLTARSIDDLTAAADLLDKWGMIPETLADRNFHLVPTLIGQGDAYVLGQTPGPAASRLQSARRSFPKDDLFFREYLFAKCFEEGLHRKYGELLMGEEWPSFRDRIEGVSQSNVPD